MKNDDTYFLVGRNPKSQIIEKHYPEMVHPFIWQDIEFFIHRILYRLGNNKPTYSKQFWQVTSKDTGMNLRVQGALTMNEAKEYALAILEKSGLDKVKEAIEQGRNIIKIN
jgi:hypothetical protein